MSRITLTSTELEWVTSEIGEFIRLGYTITKPMRRTLIRRRYRVTLERSPNFSLVWYDLEFQAKTLYGEDSATWSEPADLDGSRAGTSEGHRAATPSLKE